MNIPDNLFARLEIVFRVKNMVLKFFDADPESFRPWIRDGKIWLRDYHPGSAIRVLLLHLWRVNVKTTSQIYLGPLADFFIDKIAL